jgi:hypothetical protein
MGYQDELLSISLSLKIPLFAQRSQNTGYAFADADESRWQMARCHGVPHIPWRHRDHAEGEAPVGRREAVIQAARQFLAHEGIEGISIVRVARITGADRNRVSVFPDPRPARRCDGHIYRRKAA